MSIIPFDDRDGYIWLNGEMMPWRECKTHVISHGLHYASLVFEGERAYNGKIFKSKDHTNRLFNSAKILDFEIPWSLEKIEDTKLELLETMKLSNSYVRAFAWRGSEMIAVSAQHTKIHTAIAVWECKYVRTNKNQTVTAKQQTSELFPTTKHATINKLRCNTSHKERRRS